MDCRLPDLLKTADENGFALPAFNYSDTWELSAIIEAAEEMHSPVIVATNAQVADTHGIRYLGQVGKVKAQNSKVPVVNHLDHCVCKEKCKNAIDCGYPSVMIDGSHLSLDENIELVREIVQYAEGKDVAVEAEVGRICGNNAEGVYIGDDFLVDVGQAVKMAESAGIASLAIGIGNAHGFYTKEPKLNFERLREVNEAVSVPLVLHGGSGLREEDIRKAIRGGINKINVGTQLHHAYLAALKKGLKKNPGSNNIVNIMLPVKENVKAECKRWIRTCMSENKA